MVAFDQPNKKVPSKSNHIEKVRKLFVFHCGPNPKRIKFSTSCVCVSDFYQTRHTRCSSSGPSGREGFRRFEAGAGAGQAGRALAHVHHHVLPRIAKARQRFRWSLRTHGRGSPKKRGREGPKRVLHMCLILERGPSQHKHTSVVGGASTSVIPLEAFHTTKSPCTREVPWYHKCGNQASNPPNPETSWACWVVFGGQKGMPMRNVRLFSLDPLFTPLSMKPKMALGCPTN